MKSNQVAKITFESVIKYSALKKTNLISRLALLPGARNIVIALKNQPSLKYQIDHISFKVIIQLVQDNKHGKIFGFQLENGKPLPRITAIKNVLKPQRYLIESYPEQTTTDNGVIYNLTELNELIQEKERLIKRRNKMLGIEEPVKKKAPEVKKGKK